MILLGHLSYTSYPKRLRPWVLQKGLLVPLQKPKYIYKSLFHSYSFAAVLLFSIWQPHLHMQGHHITEECMFTWRPLNDYQLDHRSRLCSFHLLPLMMSFEITDIFFLLSLKAPSPAFDISHYVHSSTSHTHSSSLKLQHRSSHNNLSWHYYFIDSWLWNRLPSSLDLLSCSIPLAKSRL